jgi:hypothetical protein
MLYSNFLQKVSPQTMLPSKSLNIRLAAAHWAISSVKVSLEELGVHVCHE